MADTTPEYGDVLCSHSQEDVVLNINEEWNNLLALFEGPVWREVTPDPLFYNPESLGNGLPDSLKPDYPATLPSDAASPWNPRLFEEDSAVFTLSPEILQGLFVDLKPLAGCSNSPSSPDNSL
jgi:hypothetical protein